MQGWYCSSLLPQQAGAWLGTSLFSVVSGMNQVMDENELENLTFDLSYMFHVIRPLAMTRSSSF